jgi:hypothetical protein
MSESTVQPRTYKDVFNDLVEDIAELFDRPVEEVAKSLMGSASTRRPYLEELLRAARGEGNVFVPVGKAAKMLNRSTKTLGRWAESGDLPYRRSPKGNKSFLLSGLKRMKKVLDGQL